jgi:hypothetical protein
MVHDSNSASGQQADVNRDAERVEADKAKLQSRREEAECSLICRANPRQIERARLDRQERRKIVECIANKIVIGKAKITIDLSPPLRKN